MANLFITSKSLHCSPTKQSPMSISFRTLRFLTIDKKLLQDMATPANLMQLSFDGKTIVSGTVGVENVFSSRLLIDKRFRFRNDSIILKVRSFTVAWIPSSKRSKFFASLNSNRLQSLKRSELVKQNFVSLFKQIKSSNDSFR